MNVIVFPWPSSARRCTTCRWYTITTVYTVTNFLCDCCLNSRIYHLQCAARARSHFKRHLVLSLTPTFLIILLFACPITGASTVSPSYSFNGVTRQRSDAVFWRVWAHIRISWTHYQGTVNFHRRICSMILMPVTPPPDISRTAYSAGYLVQDESFSSALVFVCLMTGMHWPVNTKFFNKRAESCIASWHEVLRFCCMTLPQIYHLYYTTPIANNTSRLKL